MKQILKSRIARAVVVLAFPIAAMADLISNVTLTAPVAVSLDTGAMTASGGDLLWNGTTLTPQGAAKALNVGVSTAQAYASITQTLLQGFVSAGSSAGIPTSALAAGDIFGVLTNGGNLAKAMVTSNGGGVLAFQFTTYGAASTGGGTGSTTPTISAVQNNSSSVSVGFPNYGISPSMLFKIVGTNLAAAGDNSLHDSTKGLPTTLNGATVNVTVNGTTVHPAMYYATPTQIDAVLPAATPLGNATITVTYNNVNSAAATIPVVASALGIDIYSGSFGVATDNTTGAVLTPTASGKPGETVVLWGTGLGADPSDSDTTYTSSPHPVSTPLQAWLGGVPLNVLYSGATVYPGVSVIIFTIPASVPTGCFVPFAAVTGTGTNATASNNVTFPIMPNGGVCTDPLYGITGTQISTLTGQTTVRTGDVAVVQQTMPSTTAPVTQVVNSLAIGDFYSTTGTSYASGGGVVSIGGCILTQNIITIGSSTTTGLNAGTITLTEPSGSAVPLSTVTGASGIYEVNLAAGAIPTSGGTFKFVGSGGTDVGPFTATVNFPNPLLSWTNQSASATVSRSQGQVYTWTGGGTGTYVELTGNSGNGTIQGSYVCIAPVSAGSFTVPSYILLALPAGTGTSMIENLTSYSPFSATGLDSGIAFGAVSFAVSTSFNN